RAAEDHGLGVAALALLAVHVEEHLEVLRIADLVRGDEPRTHRPERVAPLAAIPLAAALELEIALGDVVDDAIPRHVVERLRFGNVACLRADDDSELHLPVELGRTLRLD